MEYKQYLTKTTATLAVVTLALIIIGASCWSECFSGSTDTSVNSSASAQQQNSGEGHPYVVPDPVKLLRDGDSISEEEFADVNSRVKITEDDALQFIQIYPSSRYQDPLLLEFAYGVPYVAKILANQIEEKIKTTDKFDLAAFQECARETYRKFMPLRKEWAEEGKSALQRANRKLEEKQYCAELKEALALYLVERAELEMKYDCSPIRAWFKLIERLPDEDEVNAIADSVFLPKKS
mgnify:CR=1 FL=1